LKKTQQLSVKDNIISLIFKIIFIFNKKNNEISFFFSIIEPKFKKQQNVSNK